MKHFFPRPKLTDNYLGTKTFAFSYKKKEFWPKNSQTWAEICIFCQTLALLAHLVLSPAKKQCNQGA